MKRRQQIGCYTALLVALFLTVIGILAALGLL
jgi:hypothetical protein